MTKEILELRQPGIQKPPEAELPLNNDQNGWTEVNKRRKTHKVKDTGVRGIGKGIGGQMRAVRRTIYVFLGRVDLSVTENDVSEYIKDIFDTNVLNIEKTRD